MACACVLAGSLTASAADARLDTLAQLTADPSPKVRLEALRALAKVPSAEAASLALGVLEHPMDSTLDYALWLTINDLSEPWIAALQDGTWKPEGREKQLEFALRAIRPEQASRVLGPFLANALTREGQGPWIELIGAAGTERELRALLDRVLAGGFDEPAAARALRALGEATRLRRLKPALSATEAGRLLDTPSDAVRVEALRLAAAWKELGPHLAKVTALAGDAESAPATRAAAFDALRSAGGPGAVNALARLSAAGQPPEVRRLAAAGLAALNLGAAVPVIIEIVRTLDDEAQAQDFWRAILPVREAGKAIAAALPESGVPQPAARAGMRVAREGGRADLELVTALAKASGLSSDTQALTAELFRELAAKAVAQGDPFRGEMVYRRESLACVSCHAIGGAGGKVGPDMTSIGASAPPDYLVEALLAPDAKIKEGYHGLIVTTRSGDEFIGTVARETPQEVVLRDASGAERSIAKADIAEHEQATASLMPAGLIDPLEEQERLDLIAFLSRLGKPGDFDASRSGVARKWWLHALTHTDQQNNRGNPMWDAPLSGPPWNSVLSLVSGRLTRPMIDEAAKRQFWVGTLAIHAATEIRLARPGPVRFTLDAPGAELWVAGKKIGGHGESVAELPTGTHRVLVRLDPQKIPETLRLESDAAFVLE